jgi:hypothetical protein
VADQFTSGHKSVRRSSALAALLATLCVMAIVWAIQKSTFTSDMGTAGVVPERDLSVFQRLHWLWQALLVVPALFLGTLRLRASLFIAVFDYGVGGTLGWCIAELSFVLSNPILKVGLGGLMAQAAGVSAALGAILVSLVELCRYGVRCLRGPA